MSAILQHYWFLSSIKFPGCNLINKITHSLRYSSQIIHLLIDSFLYHRQINELLGIVLKLL